MKDSMDQFMQQKRNEFNQFEPSPRVWQNIERNLAAEQQRKSFQWRKYLSRAAVILVLFATSVVTVEFLHQHGIQVVNLHGKKGFETPELKEAERYYNAQLTEKLQEAKPYLMSNPELGAELNRDLSELDSVYSDLKKDLNDKVATAEVVEALIQNYRMRIEILEDLLDAFEGPNNTSEEFENSYPESSI